MEFSLPLFYFRRCISQGKLYLIFATVFPPAVIMVFLLANPVAFSFAGGFLALMVIAPLMSIMANYPLLSFFVSDKRKGFYEYLFATTETDVSRIYSALFLGVVLVTSIPLVVTYSIAFAASYITMTLPSNYLVLFLIYSLPLSYLAPLLTIVVATTWSLTTVAIRGPITTSPVGLAGFFGFVASGLPIFIQNYFLWMGAGFFEIYSLVVFLIFAAISVLSIRTLVPERFLP